MRYSARALVFFMCLLMLIPFSALAVSAANSTSQNDLYRELTTYYSEYNLKTDDYADSGAGRNTASQIQEYVTKIGYMQSAPEDELLLVYNQGRAIGPLAWIYYTHEEVTFAPDSYPSERPEEPSDALRYDVYIEFLTQKGIIDSVSADNVSFFTDTGAGTVTECYTKMLRAVYKARLELLKLNKSEYADDINDIILSSINTVNTLQYETEDGEKFLSEYDYTYKTVMNRISWRSLNDTFPVIFSMMYPDESYAQYAALATFRNTLETKKPLYVRDGDAILPSEYNIALNSLVYDALTNEGGSGLIDSLMSGASYREAYLDSLISTVSAAKVNSESAEHEAYGTLLELEALFGNYKYDLCLSDAKDSVTSYYTSLMELNSDVYTASEKETLQGILLQYTRSGGIIDGITNDTEFSQNTDLRVAQAKLRADIFDHYISTLRAIDGYISDNSADDLRTEAASIYTSADTEIANGVIRDIDSAKHSLDDQKYEAEARRFEKDHVGVVLDKDISELSGDELDAYKQTLALAIEASEELSIFASQKLEARDTPLLSYIGEQYKRLIKKQLSDILSKTDASENLDITSIRGDSMSSLYSLVNGISLTDGERFVLADLVESSEALISKAHAINNVLSHYTENIERDSAHEFSSYGAPFKSELIEECALCAQGIISGNQTEEASIAMLDRTEALAQIDRAASAAPSAQGVSVILNSAADSLELLTEPSEIEDYADDAVFRIQNLIQADRLEDSVEALKAKISGAESLTEAQRNAYTESAGALSSYISALRGMTDEDTQKDIAIETVSEFSLGFSAIEDVVDAIQAAASSAHSARSEALSSIEALASIDPTTKDLSWKDSFISDVEDAYRALLNKLAITAEPQEAVDALGAFESEISDILGNASAKDLSNAKENAKIYLKEQASIAQNALSKHEYLSDGDKQSVIDEISSALANGASAIDLSTNTAQVGQRKKSYAELIEKASNGADAKNKDACLLTVLSFLKSCYEPDHYSKERKEQIENIIEQYTSDKLASASTVTEYEALRAEAIKEISLIPNILGEAQSAADKALTEAYEKLLARKISYSEKNLSRIKEIYEHTVSEIYALVSISDAPQINKLCAERTALMQSVPFDRLYTDNTVIGGTSGASGISSPEEYKPLRDGYSASVYSEGGIPSDAYLSVICASSEGIAEQIIQAAKDKDVWLSGNTLLSKNILKLLKDCHVSAALSISLGTEPSAGTDSYRVSVLLPENINTDNIIGVVFIRDDGSIEFYEVACEELLISFTVSHFSDYYIVSENTKSLLPWIIVLSIIILCEIAAVALLYIRRRRKQTETDGDIYSLALSPALPIFALTKYTPVGGAGIIIALSCIAAILGACIVYLALPHKRPSYSDNECDEDEIDIDELISDMDIECAVLESIDSEPLGCLPEPVQAVTAEEANILMSDEEAELSADEDYYDPETYVGSKRAQINIDTISESFSEGDTVTLNSLKAMRLVSNNVGHVKILARGTLDKPLTIVAQDFSSAAVKMILLTGGKAIITEPSPERRSYRRVYQNKNILR